MGGTDRRRRGARPAGLRPLGLGLGLVLAGFLYAAIDRESGLRTWLRLERDVAQAEQRIEGLRLRNARLRREIQALRDDPGALERAIREEIGWVQPGEIRISLGDPLAFP